MPTRRDVLRILLLGSGALYVSTPLDSCNNRTPPKLERVGSDDRERVEHQFYDTAHRYIRDNSRDGLDWKDAKNHTADVVIVGAGPAGLAAAVALTKAGLSIAIVENEPIGGGAARRGRWGDTYYPLAAIYFVERNATIEELCAFAGIEPISTPHDAVIVKGQVFNNMWDDATIASLPIPPAEKVALRRFRDDLLARRERDTIPPYPLPDELPGDLASFDSTTAAKFIATYRSPFLRSLLDLYARSSMGDSLDRVNAYALLNFYVSEITGPRYTFPGGIGGLSTAIVNKLGGYVHTNRTCIRIEGDTAPTVWALDRQGTLHRYRCRAAIVAVQKFMLPAIIPDLPQAQRAAMHSLQYSPFLTVHLGARENILPPAFDLWVPDGGPLFTDIINATATSGTSNSSTVASVYAPRLARERTIMQSDDILASLARTIAARVTETVPTVAASAIEEVHVFGWGHALVVPSPGSHNGPAQRARQRLGNIIFANTDNDSAPAFESAVAHGVRAAETAIASLKQ